MTYTIEKVTYTSRLFHAKHEKRRVKAYNKFNGLFVYRVPMMKKTYRISHVNGLSLPKYYNRRKDALKDLSLLQAKDWTNYESNILHLRELYRSVTGE